MAQLGYTWYPKDWFTSTTRKRLKRFPLVRYAMREFMYMEGAPIEMNKEYLFDDLDIELSDTEYEKLLEYISINDEGKWWINSIKRRISKAEAARENGKKGGRPKTQKPSKKTEEENPKNPPLEIERERESKREIEIETKNEKGVFVISDFEKGLRDYFSQTTEVLQMRLSSYLRNLKNNGKFDEFKKQTIAYVNYKKIKEEKIHGWLSYQAEWENTDWIDKLSKISKEKKIPKNYQEHQQIDVDRKYSTIPKI